MTLEEAIAQQPAWLTYWLYWLVFGALVLPLALLIWRETRLTAIVTVVATVIAGTGVNWMYEQMGYVKLLWLPHVLIWTPLAFYLYGRLRGDNVRVWPKRIIAVVLATILVSLAFDYLDVARYLAGERTPTAMPA